MKREKLGVGIKKDDWLGGNDSTAHRHSALAIEL